MAQSLYTLRGLLGSKGTTVQPAARSLRSTMCFRVRYSDLAGDGFCTWETRLGLCGCIDSLRSESAYDTANEGS